MKTILKRLVAYLIDIILVSAIATVLSSNKYINKDYVKYTKIYEEYTEKHNEYDRFITKLNDCYEDSKITKKEYNKILKYDKKYTKDIKKYYKDSKITKKEYNKVKENLNEYYTELDSNYSYKLLTYSYIPTIINILCILLYFVIIQYYFNGQTLGKKLMSLRVVKNKGDKLNILNYLIRSLLINEVLINTCSIICLLILSKNNYIKYSELVYVITYIFEMAVIFTITFDKDNRGLHDYICNTKVIEDKKG